MKFPTIKCSECEGTGRVYRVVKECFGGFINEEMCGCCQGKGRVSLIRRVKYWWWIGGPTAVLDTLYQMFKSANRRRK